MVEDSILRGFMNDLAGIKHQDKMGARDQEIAWKLQLIYACPYQTAKKLTRPRLEWGRPDWEIGDPDIAMVLRKIAVLKRETCRTGFLFPYRDAACFEWPWFNGVYYHPKDPRGKAILRVKELNQIALDEEWSTKPTEAEEFENKYGRKPRVFFKVTGGLTFDPFYKERQERDKFLQQMIDIGHVSWKPEEPFGAPAWGYPLEDQFFSFQLMQAVEVEKGVETAIRTRPSQGHTRPLAERYQDIVLTMYDARNGTRVRQKRDCHRWHGISYAEERPFNRFDFADIFPSLAYSNGEKRSYAEIHRDWINDFSKNLFGEMSIPTEVPEKYKSICYKYRDSQSFPVVYGL